MLLVLTFLVVFILVTMTEHEVMLSIGYRQEAHHVMNVCHLCDILPIITGFMRHSRDQKILEMHHIRIQHRNEWFGSCSNRPTV